MIWHCPKCKSSLDNRTTELICLQCDSCYPMVNQIPDLRVFGESWLNLDDDLRFAMDLATRDLPLHELVRAIYSNRPGWDEDRIEMRTNLVLAAPMKLEDDIQGWLKKTIFSANSFLDLGCGSGMLLAAAQRAGKSGIGIDVSMTWLVAAQRQIRDYGGEPCLAAAFAEWLPLADGTIGAVVSLDVIEHVKDPERYVGEINRVVFKGGAVALSTPNRFSLTREPHVFVWGVGWLPQRWQQNYVRWRSGKSYDDTVLMSSWRLSALVRRASEFVFRIQIPEVPASHISKFGRGKAFVARLYNLIRSFEMLRPMFLAVGPFFQLTGRKE